MSRFLLGLVLLTTACGGKTSGDTSLCAVQVPPPPACMTACDPSTAAGDLMCPDGYHCSPDAKCDAFCTPSGTECGDGRYCTANGYCMDGDDPGGGGGNPADTKCAEVSFTTTKKTPTVQLLL